MKKLNTYIVEAWSGVKKQSLKVEIENWCEEMGIENYTINSKGEIDVNGYVDLFNKDFKELPYKFGVVTGFFDIGECDNLTSLKNCPNEVGNYFSCNYCPKLESLEGCPKRVEGDFYCSDRKQKFTKEEVQSLCNVEKTRIYV